MPDGRFLPAGTLVGSNIWAIQRDRTVFGPDAETFRPERWLECGPEQRSNMERTVELCFSSGRYTCLGKDVAMMEIYKAVAEVRFDPQESLLALMVVVSYFDASRSRSWIH